MSEITATDAKNRFGQVLEMAQAEPVHVQKNGRDVVVVVAADEYRSLVQQAGVAKARPVVDKLIARSISRRRSLYEALAK